MKLEAGEMSCDGGKIWETQDRWKNLRMQKKGSFVITLLVIQKPFDVLAKT